MFLIVGLGNPGFRYQHTRHNLGFMIVDHIVQERKTQFQRGKGPYLISQVMMGSHTIIFAKPLTYMNRSGIAVDDLVKRYAIEMTHLLILCDDLNLPLGKLRIRAKGSHGGHNGLASIINYLRTDAFPRLRLGIGNHHPEDTVQFVLSSFDKNESSSVKRMIHQGCEAVSCFVKSGIHITMNTYN